MTASASDHHAFISFSSRDQAKARLICEHLERSGVRCWISLRDVEPGSNYQASIVRAIQVASIMVLVFSDNTNQSGEVHKELSLASAFKVSVMPVRIVDVRPVGALLYELATRQWIDAFEEWDLAMERLAATARASLADPGTRPPALPEVLASTSALPPAPMQPKAAARHPEPVARHTFSEEQLDGACVALAHYLGPIADLLVRKASAKSSSLSELYDRLASHIRNAEEQTAFKSRVGARSQS